MRESEVFLMRNTKWELNPYSFYDTEGLARHFERMAAEGWAPDRVGLFIRYRRIKPQKLRFAITYYPDDGGARCFPRVLCTGRLAAVSGRW